MEGRPDSLPSIRLTDADHSIVRIGDTSGFKAASRQNQVGAISGTPDFPATISQLSLEERVGSCFDTA